MLAGLGAAGIATAAAAPAALAEALRPVPQAASGERGGAADLFRIERVSDGVYAAIARPAPMLNCNAAVIVTEDHVLVVDTHSKPSAASALINQIRREVSDRPVRYVINSHFHWDHAQGNLAYPKAFGQSTEVISSTSTREWMAREGASRLRQSLDALPKRIADLRTQLAAAKIDDERARLTEQIKQLEAYSQEMDPPEKQITLPTITFNERLVIHRGGREIHLIFLGRGHTAGDVVVYIPSERTVATGDLMHGLLPYMGDGYPEEWPRTLVALEALDFTHVVAGHGSVQQGKSILAFFRAYIEELNEGVARGVERGLNLEEMQRTLAPEGLRSLKMGDQMTRLAREGQGFSGVPLAGAQLQGAVAANIADVYNYYTKRRGRS